MGANSKIEWCRHTFNPWYGCQKVSPACDFCYAESWAKRSGLVQWGPHAPRRRSSAAKWREPLKWNAAAAAAGEIHTVFSCSLGDIFDNHVPAYWRADFFNDAVRKTPNLLYLLLTKRPQNIIELSAAAGGLPDNCAIGTTVEDQARADLNIPALLEAKAKLQPRFAFLSCEPLLGPIDLTPEADLIYRKLSTWYGPDGFDPSGSQPARERRAGYFPRIDWVICGGESGPQARPMHPDWARSLRDQCAAASVPFFFKQWGEHSPAELLKDGIDPGVPWRIEPNGKVAWAVDELRLPREQWPDVTYWRAGKARAGRLLDGREHNDMPAFSTAHQHLQETS